MKLHSIANQLTICLLLLCTVSACNDEPKASIPKNEPYPVTNFNTVSLQTTTVDDGPAVTTTHTYSYQAGRLQAYDLLQTVGHSTPVEISSHSQVSYTDNQAIVRDDYGNTSTYTLNSRGYATECLRQEAGCNTTRHYTFGYMAGSDGKYYLTSVCETIDDSTTPFSQLTLSYDSEHSINLRLDMQGQTYCYQASADADNLLPNTSELPALFLSNLHPLSLHHEAIYGKWLGDAWPYLVQHLSPIDNEESTERTDYTYQLDTNGIVTGCVVQATSYGQSYRQSYTYSLD